MTCEIYLKTTQIIAPLFAVIAKRLFGRSIPFHQRIQIAQQRSRRHRTRTMLKGRLKVADVR